MRKLHHIYQNDIYDKTLQLTSKTHRKLLFIFNSLQNLEFLNLKLYFDNLIIC
jgi:hypothetical protein